MKSETWDLIESLRNRTDLGEAGRKALKEKYPDAPPEMIDSAAFHLFSDGAEAAVNWLAALEQFLRTPEKGVDSGATFHLLYHLYNWEQFEALLPPTTRHVAALLTEAKDGLEEKDYDFVARRLAELHDMFQAGLQPPQLLD